MTTHRGSPSREPHVRTFYLNSSSTGTPLDGFLNRLLAFPPLSKISMKRLSWPELPGAKAMLPSATLKVPVVYDPVLMLDPILIDTSAPSLTSAKHRSFVRCVVLMFPKESTYATTPTGTAGITAWGSSCSFRKSRSPFASCPTTFGKKSRERNCEPPSSTCTLQSSAHASRTNESEKPLFTTSNRTPFSRTAYSRPSPSLFVRASPRSRRGAQFPKIINPSGRSSSRVRPNWATTKPSSMVWKGRTSTKCCRTCGGRTLHSA